MFLSEERVQYALSLVFADLLDFCVLTISFLNRKGIKILWKITWKDFERRSKTIVGNINRHKALADVEAVVSRMDDMGCWRKEDKGVIQAFQMRELIRWLNPVDCQYHLEISQRSRTIGTGEWFLNHSEVLEWKNRQTSILWLHGIPGHLKSLPVDNNDGVAQRILVFFFCDTTIPENRTSIAVLRTIISQLITKLPVYVEVAFQSMLRSGQQRATSFEVLLQLFREILKGNSGHHIDMVLDAWDECEDGGETPVLAELLKQAKDDDSNFQLFVSSRNEPDIREHLFSERQIRLTPSLVKEDLRLYVSARLSQSRLGFFRSKDYQSCLVTKVVDKSNGQFLWVKLVVESLLKATFHWELKEIMNDLPQGLDKAYSRVLKRLSLEPPRRQDAAVRLLQWLACAERVMSTKELGAALAIREGDTDADPIGQVIDLCGFIKDVCGSLIELRDPLTTSAERTVRFVHRTFKGYLLSPTSQSDQDEVSISKFKVQRVHANRYMSDTCITQLSFRSLSKAVAAEGKIQIAFPFLDYSSNFWATHLSQSGMPDGNTMRRVFDFVRSSGFQSYLERQGESKSDVSQITLLQSQLNTWISKCGALDHQMKSIADCFKTQYAQAVAQNEARFGSEHVFTLNSLFQLANLTHIFGDWAEAKPMYERVLDGRMKHFGEENQQTLDSMFQLATVLARLGELEESQRLHSKTLDHRRKILGPIHAGTLLSEDGLAHTLNRRNLLDKAETLSRETLRTKTRVFGHDDIRTIYSANNLAAILKDIGIAHQKDQNRQMSNDAWQECEALSLKCLSVREAVLGREHPETITVVNMLGIVTRHLGRPEESEEFNRRALHVRLKLFGPESPHTQRSMRNLLSALRDQCKDQEVSELEARLERSLKSNPIFHFIGIYAAIIGIVIGTVTLSAIIATAVYMRCCRRRRSTSPPPEKSSELDIQSPAKDGATIHCTEPPVEGTGITVRSLFTINYNTHYLSKNISVHNTSDNNMSDNNASNSNTSEEVFRCPNCFPASTQSEQPRTHNTTSANKNNNTHDEPLIWRHDFMQSVRIYPEEPPLVPHEFLLSLPMSGRAIPFQRLRRDYGAFLSSAPARKHRRNKNKKWIMRKTPEVSAWFAEHAAGAARHLGKELSHLAFIRRPENFFLRPEPTPWLDAVRDVVASSWFPDGTITAEQLAWEIVQYGDAPDDRVAQLLERDDWIRLRQRVENDLEELDNKLFWLEKGERVRIRKAIKAFRDYWFYKGDRHKGRRGLLPRPELWSLGRGKPGSEERRMRFPGI
ncbi:hypothetical protein SLS58_007777 [Diplodia intermedia]|uniref:Uncharacterized protein n=1 Tax=Diplodia intermedia TaxID=856260 RepID=A0ABR3TJ56_9PEZI